MAHTYKTHLLRHPEDRFRTVIVRCTNHNTWAQEKLNTAGLTPQEAADLQAASEAACLASVQEQCPE